MPIVEDGYCDDIVVNIYTFVQMSFQSFETAQAYVTDLLRIAQRLE